MLEIKHNQSKQLREIQAMVEYPWAGKKEVVECLNRFENPNGIAKMSETLSEADLPIIYRYDILPPFPDLFPRDYPNRIDMLL
jgi:hypothetical protein